jgi:hypothetical protein
MTKLCPRGKAAAKRKFAVYPSAYANAYASKICAGKIKDPSGVKRKDFKGPKPAGKKVGGMTAGAQSALGRIQKANMMKRKGGLQLPVIDKVRPTLKKKSTKPRFGSMDEMRRAKGFKPGETAAEFNKRRMALATAKEAAKASKFGKIALAIAATALAGKTAVEKMYEKRTGKKPVTKRPRVDKKRMGGLKSELNNPARGYTKGGIARGGGAAIKGTDFKGVF